MIKLPPRRVFLPTLVLIVNLALVLTNLGLLWRVNSGNAQIQHARAQLAQAQTSLIRAASELTQAQADADRTLKAMRLCHDGVNELQPGETCFIKITAPMPGQKL